MRLFLEEYAYFNALKNTSASLKVLFVLSNLILGVFSASPITPFIIFSMMVFITIFVAKIRVRQKFFDFSFFLKINRFYLRTYIYP